MTRGCPFCTIANPVVENELAFALYDTWPVTEGHLLIIPKRHYASIFEASREELEAIAELVKRGKAMLDEKYKPDGYNIGVNIGRASGQTIMHVHLHLIPRFVGDVAEPLGGVRGVIPARQKYPSP
ncbi:MAG: HIT family protein [Syntrophobacteraceae bacterium]